MKKLTEVRVRVRKRKRRDLTYDHPAGSVPTDGANLAIHSGLFSAKEALLPVQLVHQLVVVYITIESSIRTIAKA